MFLIETERLVIRPWQPDDRPAFTSLMSHPEVTQYVHGGHTLHRPLSSMFTVAGSDLRIVLPARISRSRRARRTRRFNSRQYVRIMRGPP